MSEKTTIVDLTSASVLERPVLERQLTLDKIQQAQAMLECCPLDVEYIVVYRWYGSPGAPSSSWDEWRVTRNEQLVHLRCNSADVEEIVSTRDL